MSDDVKAPRPNTTLITFSMLASGARLLLPPLWSMSVVRSVRGAMLDRIAREAGVRLTPGARRVLVDFEANAGTARGLFEQFARLATGRFVPIAPFVEVAQHTLFAFGAGALFHRYVTTHREGDRDTSISSEEAQRVRRALRDSIEIISLDHVRALTRVAMESFGNARELQGNVMVKYGMAMLDAIRRSPDTWIDVMDESFRRTVNEAGISRSKDE